MCQLERLVRPPVAFTHNLVELRIDLNQLEDVEPDCAHSGRDLVRLLLLIRCEQVRDAHEAPLASIVVSLTLNVVL